MSQDDVDREYAYGSDSGEEGADDGDDCPLLAKPSTPTEAASEPIPAQSEASGPGVWSRHRTATTRTATATRSGANKVGSSARPAA